MNLAANLFFLALFMHPMPADSKPIDWPEPINIKIEEILSNKKSAMEFPSMRSENGILGKRCEILMDELGNQITDPILIQEIQAIEGEDIKAKIALWAVDRKKRFDEYKRFSKYYVNEPAMNEVIEYYRRIELKMKGGYDEDPFNPNPRPEDFIPRPGTWTPNPVDKEDQVEKIG